MLTACCWVKGDLVGLNGAFTDPSQKPQKPLQVFLRYHPVKQPVRPEAEMSTVTMGCSSDEEVRCVCADCCANPMLKRREFAREWNRPHLARAPVSLCTWPS